MNRIDARFKQLSASGRKALVPYMCAGHPTIQATVPTLHALVKSGADLLELGVPFSDPMADGPVIQQASETALAQGVGMAEVLAAVKAFRDSDEETPVVLMGYLNPIHRYGLPEFSRDAAAAGVDGVLLVDSPPEESVQLSACLQDQGLHQIFLVAPTTSPERARLICQVAGGFVYYVSLKGVTGASTLAADEVRTAVERLREHTGLPIGVGFGIKNAEDAARLAPCCDAVVIGSALVRALDDAQEQAPGAAAAFLAPIRKALDQLSNDPLTQGTDAGQGTIRSQEEHA